MVATAIKRAESVQRRNCFSIFVSERRETEDGDDLSEGTSGRNRFPDTPCSSFGASGEVRRSSRNTAITPESSCTSGYTVALWAAHVCRILVCLYAGVAPVEPPWGFVGEIIWIFPAGPGLCLSIIRKEISAILLSRSDTKIFIMPLLIHAFLTCSPFYQYKSTFSLLLSKRVVFLSILHKLSLECLLKHC